MWKRLSLAILSGILAAGCGKAPIADKQEQAIVEQQVTEEQGIVFLAEDGMTQRVLKLPDDQAELLQLVSYLDTATQNARDVGAWTKESENLEKSIAVSKYLFETYERLGYERETVDSWLDVYFATAASLSMSYVRQGQFERATSVSESCSRLARMHYGASHWKATDQQLNLEVVTKLKQLTSEDRTTYFQMWAKDAQIDRLDREGKSGLAVDAAKEIAEYHRSVFGEWHPDYATSLENLAWLHHSMGDYAQAEVLFQRALEIHKKVLGERHPRYAASLHNLAWLYGAKRDYAQAEPLYRQALEIRKEVLGERHPDYADSLRNLAWLYGEKGDYAQAEPLYRQTLEIRKKELGERHPDYAASLHELAWLYGAKGDYAQAEPLYRQTLEIRKEVLGERHPDYAASLHNLATMYDAKRDYAQAESLYRQALEIRKEVLGERHPDYAICLRNLAELYREMEDYAQAEPLSRQALEIRKEVLGERHPDYADSLHNLAMLYGAKGDYAQAEPLYRQTLEIRKEVLGERHPHYAAILHNLAALYRDMGDYLQAEPLFQQALEIHREVLDERHPTYATNLDNLALLYYSTEDYGQAEVLYRQALEIRKELLGERHPHYAASLHNLALLYGAKGDYAQAEPLYRQALEIDKEALGERHTLNATSLDNLAKLYHEMGNYAQAMPLFRQALEIRKELLGERHRHYAGSLHNLALLYHAMGDDAQAEVLAGEALKIVAANLDSSSMVQSQRQQIAMNDDVRYHLNSYLSVSLSDSVSANGDRTYANVSGWKGAVLARQNEYRQLAADPALASQFTSLRQTTAHWSALSSQPPTTPEMLESWRDQVEKLRQVKERLEADLGRQSAAFREARTPWKPSQLQELLPTGTVLVDLLEYTHFDRDPNQKGEVKKTRSLVAFVIPASGKIQVIPLGPAAEIHLAIQTWRQLLGTAPAAQAAGNLLREKLWEPIVPYIGDAETILISPDGQLGTFPFAALPGKQPGTYLLEDHRIAMLPVPRLLPKLMREETTELPNDLLVVGGIDYERRSTEQQQLADSGTNGHAFSVRGITEHLVWPQLDGAQKEAEFIRGLYQRSFSKSVERLQFVSGAAATEDAFRRLAPKCSIVHVATHGFFAPAKFQSALKANPQDQQRLLGLGKDEVIRGYDPNLLSGLVFAGANHPPELDATKSEIPDDGILTAEEIAFLPLNGVDLVVLSACETGLGEVAGGEGLLGLQRSFQISGARSTIASYWKVDDVVTQRLMERFYTNYLEKKLSKLDALREAQLWVLNNPQEFPHIAKRRGDKTRRDVPVEQQKEFLRLPPEYWAAFSLSGDWRN